MQISLRAFAVVENYSLIEIHFPRPVHISGPLPELMMPSNGKHALLGINQFPFFSPSLPPQIETRKQPNRCCGSSGLAGADPGAGGGPSASHEGGGLLQVPGQRRRRQQSRWGGVGRADGTFGSFLLATTAGQVLALWLLRTRSSETFHGGQEEEAGVH